MNRTLNSAARVFISVILVFGLSCIPTSLVHLAFADTSLAAADVEIFQANYQFNGEQIRPQVYSVTLNNRILGSSNYVVSYGLNVNAGKGEVVVTGRNGYTGSKTVQFDINRTSISRVNLETSMLSRPYSGSEYKPTFTLTMGDYALLEGRDYTVTYSGESVDPGSYTAKISSVPDGNFSGSLPDIGYEITSVTLDRTSLSMGNPEVVYTGSPVSPDMEVKGAYDNVLTTPDDYTLTFRDAETGDEISKPVNVGDYQAVIEGKGGYEGTLVADFSVTPAHISAADITLTPEEYTYDGREKKPHVSAVYQQKTLGSKDYSVEYRNNILAGTAGAVVTGKGNFTGSVLKEFTINPIQLSDSNIAIESSVEDFTGAPVLPKLVITSPDGSVLETPDDYIVTYRDADGNPVDEPKDAGEYTIEITGTGGYAGTFERDFEIDPASIADAEVTLDPETCVYDGTDQEPEVTVTLNGNPIDEDDYTVAYANNREVGTATVTLTGKNNLEGTKRVTFEIAPAVTPIDMLRVYNPNSGEHFYTVDTEERDALVKVGWNYEGIGWVAPDESATPVYRLYSGTDHHYTMDVKERDWLITQGWKDEGIGWYSDDAETIPLYRQYNPNVEPSAPTNNSGSHNYTTSKSENDWLVAVGWDAEGIGWYALEEGRPI